MKAEGGMMGDYTLLHDLVAAIEASFEEGDLIGHVRSWLDLAEGRVSEDDTASVTPEGVAIMSRIERTARRAEAQARKAAENVRPASPSARQAQALQLLARDGFVTSSRLAQVAGVTAESARTTLVDLVQRGTLRRRGSYRATYYILA